MPEVFADTFYWIALINPADQWHQDAKAFSQANAQASIVTTEPVLTEVLNYFSEAGVMMLQGRCSNMRSCNPAREYGCSSAYARSVHPRFRIV
ncbi:MAG: hypothetical protein QOK48_2284 [Blastocatellia bacterium]|nr:hypothetical protein [Blastocatellia bacterium]